MSLRARLLWLGISVLLPALALVIWIVEGIHRRETEDAERSLSERVAALALVVDREIDKRAMIARTLGTARSLAQADLARFHEDARRATDGTGNWVLLADGARLVLSSRAPPGESPSQADWPLDRVPPLEHAEVTNLRDAPMSGTPALAVFAPAPVAARYSVGIAFTPAAIQSLLDGQHFPPGWIAAVVDREQRIVARSLDPERSLGKSTPKDFADAARAAPQGLARTRSLEGTPVAASYSRSPQYGWVFVIAVPQELLGAAARRAALQAAAASSLLVLFTLGLALLAARRLAVPIRELGRAADRLEAGDVPPVLDTGLVEADAVSRALHRAAARVAQSHQALQQQVAEAVARHDALQREQAGELLRLITDKMPVLIGYVDHEFRFRLANRAYEVWYGRPRDHIVGRTVAEVIGEAGWGRIRPAMTRALAGEEQVVEAQRRYPGVGLRWVEAAYLPHRDAAGRVEGFAVLVQDISVHKQAEQALRRAAQTDRLLVAIHDGTRGLSDASQVQWQVVSHLGEHYGVSRALYGELDADGEVVLVERDFADGVPSVAGRHRLADFGTGLTDTLRAGRPVVIDDVRRHPLVEDAAARYEALQVRAMLGVPLLRDGRLVGLLVLHHDRVRAWSPEDVALLEQVAQRTGFTVDTARAQAALRESRDVLALAMRSGRMGAWSRDMESGHVWWSPELLEIFGIAPCDFGNSVQSFREHVHEDDRAALDAAIRRALTRGEDYAVEFRFRHGSGEWRWMEGRGLAVYDARGRAAMLYGLGIDITARRLADEELRRLNADLSEAHRRKDEFLATLAHELRNPLAPISSALEVMRLHAPVDPQLRWTRDMIERQVRHMTRLVDDLLDVARITRGKVQLRRERLDVAAVVQAAVEAVGPLIDTLQHRLVLQLPQAPLWIDADPTRVAQVVANLLNNAAKYTPPGGRITVAVTAEDGWMRLAVRDNGIGIAPEHLGGVFEMFSQVTPALDRSQGGLGIGLALVRGLVELHGGTVGASSAGPGEGSEFTIRLPLAAAGAAVEVPPPPPPQAGPRRRVLVVDDNRDAAESLAVMLELVGHEAKVVHDGLAALAAWPPFGPDVVLLDIGLPGLNGYEVARRARAADWGRDATLVAVTGWGQEEDRRRAMEAGFDHHLTKPVDPGALEAIVGIAG